MKFGESNSALRIVNVKEYDRIHCASIPKDLESFAKGLDEA